MTSESGDERDTKSPAPSSATNDSRDYGKGRKSIFRKKLIKNKVDICFEEEGGSV